jgi:two-component system response regulator MprA
MTTETRKPHVLLVDDDARLLLPLNRALSLKGFEVEMARHSGEALEVIDRGWQDVIVLDVMMPVVDGVSLCRLLRDRVSSPILMLTALDSVSDRVRGLEAGADDYMAKPFDTNELAARLTALLRRAKRESEPEETRLTYKDLSLDAATWEAKRDEHALNLTSNEFRVLEVLLRAQGRVLAREDILTSIGRDGGAVESNLIDVYVMSLRQKLEAFGGARLIQTIRRVGYVLRA